MSTTYRVTFDRIGRNHDVPPLDTEATNADTLASAIYDYARPHLLSRDLEVDLFLPDPDLPAGVPDGGGVILCGFQSGGGFTIARLDGAR